MGFYCVGMRYRIFALAAFLLIFAPLAALAGDHPKSVVDPTTQREKGVFAFFSLGSGPPDFERWIMSWDDYSAFHEQKDREKYLIDQSIRLGTGYGLFDPKKDLLNIETIVSVHYVAPKDGQPGKIYFNFPEQSADYIPTFSYPYVKDEWVSLIINKLALFAELPLSDEHMATVSQHLSFENQDYEAVLSIQVRPSEADHSKPIKIGTIRQWIMIGEIAYMKCEVDSDKTGRREQLWDYVAPWYAEEHRLKNLPEDMKYPHPFDLKK
jgi:hypothetical protein